MKPLYFAYFFIYYALKVLESGFTVAIQILKGSRGVQGVFINYHPVLEKDWHVVLLFNLISMTPGSLSVDISDNKDIILVHLLNRDDEANFMAITKKIEQLLAKSL